MVVITLMFPAFPEWIWVSRAAGIKTSQASSRMAGANFTCMHKLMRWGQPANNNNNNTEFCHDKECTLTVLAPGKPVIVPFFLW
jgi:hypothetical protein